MKIKNMKFEIRMYKMGTGDCFAIKLENKEGKIFKILIDCGAKSGTEERLTPYVKDLLFYFDNSVDLLIVTHEHQDHVLGFNKCNKLFDKLIIEQIWLGWSENDKDTKVKEWKKAYGQKVKNLAFINDLYQKRVKQANNIGPINKHFAASLNDYSRLNIGEEIEYKGGLPGMKYVKNMKSKETSYYKAGDVITNPNGFEGVRFFILGPPNNWEEVKKEKGNGNETYQENLKAVNSIPTFSISNQIKSNLPFDHKYLDTDKIESKQKLEYNSVESKSRTIENEWLNSAGNLALRLDRGLNNLSLVLAIEFIESGEVLLFPGDAEIGSWNSWHNIDWNEKNIQGEKITTEDLLNRTIFYKVAHHMSHNGTAKEKGLKMMTSPELVAMASVDYSVIHSGWKKTMPNRAILNELLLKTKGRTILMNENDIYCDRNNTITIAEKRKEYGFDLYSSPNFENTDLFVQYSK